MNIKIFSSVITLLVLLSSCQDFLEVKTKSNFADDVIFSDANYAEDAIMAVYNVFGENNSYRNRLWLQMGINTDIEYRPGVDDGLPSTSIKADDVIALYNASTAVGDGFNNTDKANPWSRIYQGIESANLAIAGITTYGNPEEGSALGHLLGEALTLRAFFYYDLIKWWGDVPARFEPVKTETIVIPTTPRAIIYDQIIADLGKAIPLMYAGGSDMTATTKRFSKDAARGLRARIALSAAGYSMQPTSNGASEIKISVSDERRLELYEIAREECRDIIDDGIYSLDDSFQNIFFEQCQDKETHGREVIFQLPYNFGTRGRMMYNLALPREAEADKVEDATFTTKKIGGQFRVMPTFFYDYNSADLRRDVTVVPYSVKKSTIDNMMEQTLGSGIVGFNIAKWRAEWYGGSSEKITGTDDGVSPIVLRYADVLLMFAEADLYLGGSEGEVYFNKVRRRAFGDDQHDLPLTLENIINERAYEFCGENIRKYDLIRWGILGSKITETKNNLLALREGTGNYADVPAVVYYKVVELENMTPGERGLVIYGLNRGENIPKTGEEWVDKDWTNAFSETAGDFVLSNNFINYLVHGDPDKRQLLPIMDAITNSSNGVLYNNYGY